jgi:hypothetical protein
MSWTAAMAVSLLAALGRPRWWAIGLAGFLVRGGLLALVLPIVILPTPAGVANLVAPTLVGFVFGGPSPAFLGLVGVILLAALAWLIGAGFLGAWLDVVLVREVAGDDELEPAARAGAGADRPRGLALRALAARLLAHAPTLAVLAWAGWRVVPATYTELISPGNPDIPVVLRVVARVPDVLVLVLASWAIGEAVGGLAVRRLAAGVELRGALGRSWADVVRRPATLATALITDIAVLGVAILAASVLAVTWNELRIVLVDGGTASEVRLALLVFSASWLAGAWLLAIAVTWRQVAWTFEAFRPRHP